MRHPRFFHSFRYAATGILTAIQQERNMRFHVCASIYVLLFSSFYNFTKTEYAILIILICGVLALELVNSSLERTVDRPSPDRYQSAGAVKDMAAGAVLVFSIGAAVCGFLMFWDLAVIMQIISFFMAYPLAIVCLIISLVISGYFIFGK